MSRQKNLIKSVNSSVDENFKRSIRDVLNDVNLGASFRPMYKFSRTFGLMPFTLVADAKGNIRAQIRLFDILWFIVCIYLCLMMAFIYYQSIQLPKGQHASSVLAYGNAFLTILGLMYVITAIIMDMINRFKLIAILRMLNNFDNKVGARKPFQYQKKLSFFLFCN